jgi:hypothetical protein
MLGRTPKNGEAFEVVLRRVGASTTITVDGTVFVFEQHLSREFTLLPVGTVRHTTEGLKSLAWMDDGGMSPPFGGGYVGLRQMATTVKGTYTHFDVHNLELDDAPVSAATFLDPKAPPPPSLFEARCERALEVHITSPFPSMEGGDPWGISNYALARLALNGVANTSLAAEISAELAAYSTTPAFTPWNNYTVEGPMGGLGPLPVLVRMALLPRLRKLLSKAAIASLEMIMFGWLSPRSNVKWAGTVRVFRQKFTLDECH